MSETEATLIKCRRLARKHPGYGDVFHIVIASPGMKIDDAALECLAVAQLTGAETWLLFNDTLVSAKPNETNIHTLIRRCLEKRQP